MAATVDGLSVGWMSTTASSLSITHDAGAVSGHGLLVCVVSLRGDNGVMTISNVTYNGVALTKLTEVKSPSSSGAVTWHYTQASWWWLDAPADGSNTLTVQFSEGVGASFVGAYNVTGHDAADPIGAVATTASGLVSDDITVSITTESADAVVMHGGGIHGGDSDPFTPNVDTTEDDDGATNTDTSFDHSFFLGRKTVASAGTTSIGAVGAVSDNAVGVAVEIKAAGGSSPVTGTGALVAGSASIAGEGFSGSFGQGILAAQLAAMAGEGFSGSFGTGQLEAENVTVEGFEELPPVVGGFIPTYRPRRR